LHLAYPALFAFSVQAGFFQERKKLREKKEEAEGKTKPKANVALLEDKNNKKQRLSALSSLRLDLITTV